MFYNFCTVQEDCFFKLITETANISQSNHCLTNNQKKAVSMCWPVLPCFQCDGLVKLFPGSEIALEGETYPDVISKILASAFRILEEGKDGEDGI